VGAAIDISLVAVWLACSGCQLVFSLDPVTDPPTPGCSEDDVKLCLSFGDGLVGDTTTDESGNDNDALISKVTRIERKGHNAARLTAASEITIKNVNTLNFGGPLSFDAFLRWRGGGDATQAIVDNVEAYGIAINTSGSVFCTIILDTTPFVSIASTAFMPGITIDVWHHVACVYDPEVGLTVYLDGMPRMTEPNGIQNMVATNRGGRVHVGSLDDGSAKFLGDVDDVRVLTRALTEGEIIETVNAD